MRIIIGADLVPTTSNYNLFEKGDIETLIGNDLIDELYHADYRIFNLETPLTDKVTPIVKCGPNFQTPLSMIRGMMKINPCFFSLANNHILDQGEQGVINTIKCLEENKIGYGGVGENLKEASKPYFFERKGIKAGVYCCAEHEFSIATESTYGANPFDPLESLDHITDMKKQCDIAIVLYHGGKEHYRYPSPNLQRICRKIVDKGADLVICQHSHCIGCEEKWNSGVIVYGQGNFLFDNSNSEFWKTGLLVVLDFDKTMKQTSVSYVPIIKRDNVVRKALNEDGESIMKQFLYRSEEIKEAGIVEKKYHEFAQEKQWEYLNAFCGRSTRNKLFKIFDILSGYRFGKWYINRKYSPKQRLGIHNRIRCEAHRELLLEGIK